MKRLAILFLALPVAANAVPITFTFDMPDFDTFDRAGENGGPLSITVDNGGTSAISQTFLNTDIIGMAVPSLSNTSMFYSGVGSALTTDALGVATLSFLGGGFYYAFADGAGSSRIQVGRSCDFFVRRAGETNSQGGAAGCGQTIWPVVQSTTTAVPVPGTVALLGIGLACLGLARRRKEIV